MNPGTSYIMAPLAPDNSNPDPARHAFGHGCPQCREWWGKRNKQREAEIVAQIEMLTLELERIRKRTGT